MSIRTKIILTFSILTLLVGVFLSAYLNSYLRSVFATEIKITCAAWLKSAKVLISCLPRI